MLVAMFLLKGGLYQMMSLWRFLFPEFGDCAIGTENARLWLYPLSLRKELCNIFAKYGLKITIEANKKVITFLEITLDLANDIYLPCNKPGNVPLYANKKSNHPPCIFENIPKSIKRRLSEISTDKDSFNKAAPLYQKALIDIRYYHNISFSVPTAQSPISGRRNCHRDII